MTALSKYQRLESPGLWHDTGDAQRRDVIVSFGDATLVISDGNERALAHWSLPAIERLNPGQRPALFSPAIDAEETLELDDDTMIGAIEKVRSVIARRRPQPGRLRLVMLGASLTAVVAVSVFWLPNALVSHTVSVVPNATRDEIGQTLLASIGRVSGKPCTTPNASRTLTRLKTRLMPNSNGSIVVLPAGVTRAEHLPGGYVLLNRALVEDYEDPDVVAGYVLAEMARAKAKDPLERLLLQTGLGSTFRLLTTGHIPAETLSDYAEKLLTLEPAPVSSEDLLALFASAEVRSTPYAYAQDVSGETTLHYIEADPFVGGAPRAVMTDGDWISLQGICGG